MMIGDDIYSLVKRLYPINRSISGNGVRETLRIIQEIIPINIHEIKSGTQVYDWTIPPEWNVKKAYIKDSDGNKVVDIEDNNLHLMGYSIPINKKLSLDELQKHLYSLPEQPDAIPYRTSYYDRRWGFCIEDAKRKQLKDCMYHVVIDSELKEDGSMTYADLLIAGKSDKEVLISTYTCHLSMANNELSGPCVATYVAKWLMKQDNYYTYRFIFIPEAIGAMMYMHKHYEHMKDNVIAGVNLSCVGDPGRFSFIPTRYENTLSDKIALNLLGELREGYTKYSFLDRGSNEKIFCAPGFDLPVVNITKSKFNTFPEYHTSLDNLDFVTSVALEESRDMHCRFIRNLESNCIYVPKFSGEPFLAKYKLYKQRDSNTLPEQTQIIKDFLAYTDTKNDLIDISNIIKVPVYKLIPIVDILLEYNIIERIRI